MHKRKEVILEGVGSLKFGELSDVDTTHAVPEQSHTLAFTGRKWVAFADPVQQTDWFIDIKRVSPHVLTGKEHKVRKVVNSGTRLRSYIPETKNLIVVQDPDKRRYMLKKKGNNPGTLRIHSEFNPPGIIGLGVLSSTILLEIILRDRPDDFIEAIHVPCFKLKWPQTHDNKKVQIYILVKETHQVRFTPESIQRIQHQTEYRTINLDKIYLGLVSLNRFRFTPGELTLDQSTVIIKQ